MKVWIGYSDGRYSFSTELKIGSRFVDRDFETR